MLTQRAPQAATETRQRNSVVTRKAKGAVLLAALCAVQVVAVALYFRSRGIADDLHTSDDDARQRAQQQFREAGVPIQRKRIDDFIAQTRAYPDLDALAAGLNDRVQTEDQFDIVFAVGVQTQDPMKEMQFAKVLADRRVARMYALLKALPAADAAREAAALVDAKLRIHDEYLRGLTASGGRRERGADVRRNFHALSASVFLCAVFCDAQTVLEKVDKWNDTIGRLVDEVKADPALRRPLWNEFFLYGRPEKLYLLNLYAFALEQSVALTAKQLEQKLDIREPGLFLERVPFTTWDAHTNYFDFTRVHRGVPVDAGNALFEVSFARSWRHLQFRDTQQEALLSHVRASISKDAGGPEAGK